MKLMAKSRSSYNRKKIALGNIRSKFQLECARFLLCRNSQPAGGGRHAGFCCSPIMHVSVWYWFWLHQRYIRYFCWIFTSNGAHWRCSALLPAHIDKLERERLACSVSSDSCQFTFRRDGASNNFISAHVEENFQIRPTGSDPQQWGCESPEPRDVPSRKQNVDSSMLEFQTRSDWWRRP